MNSELKNRLVISLPLVSVLTLVIFYATGFAQFFGALVLLRSLWEFLQLYKNQQVSFKWPAIVFSAFYLYSVAHFSPQTSTALGLMGFVGLFGLQMLDVDNQKGMAKIALTLVGFIYIIYFGSHFILLHNMAPDARHWGSSVLFTAIFICKFSDATAYFGGRYFGKRKLIPRVSPNKTREGLYCAYLGALVPWPFLTYLNGFNVWTALGFCLLLATMAFIGDLFESMLKRELKVKDTANDIPAFGGTLDMIDSIILSMPAAYWYIQILGIQP